MNWPTDPSIHQITHVFTYPKVGNVSTYHKLSHLDQVLLKFLWFYMIWPINAPTHQTKHPPMGGGVSMNLKSLSKIEISWLIKFLSHFYWSKGVPLGGEWGHHMCGGYLQFSNMFFQCFMHVHVCSYMCICLGTPAIPTPLSTHPPTHLMGGGNIQNSEILICLELIEIILFCLPLNTPELI